MKNMKKILMLLILILVLQLTACNNTQTTNNTAKSSKNDSIKSSILSDKEIKQLSEIDNSLYQNPDIIQLKKTGYLDDFIKNLQNQYNTQKEQELSDKTQELTKWGLNPQKTTVSDLEKIAQKYLNSHYNGIKIGSTEFNNLVKTNFTGENDLAKKAKDDPGFGPLYVYMCIYDDNITDSLKNDKSSLILSEEINNKTLLQICEDNFKTDFKENQVNIILKNYLESKNIQTNDSNQTTTKVIQSTNNNKSTS